MLRYIILSLALVSCGSHVNSNQLRQMKIIKESRPESYVEVKDPGIAFWFGILPGGGSFYTEQYGYGVLNLLSWPLSILWDPLNGQGGANDLNYEQTMIKIKKDKAKLISELDDLLDSKKISSDDYFRRSKKIEREFTFE